VNDKRAVPRSEPTEPPSPLTTAPRAPETATSAENRLEIGHVLFIEIVGCAQRPIQEQRTLQHWLRGLVRDSPEFRAAEAEAKVLLLPTANGMALVFFHSGEAPIRCAREITQAPGDRSKLPLRMGIHTGPVSTVTDVNNQANIAGGGINMAQRVMDVGDAGHILLSKRGAEDLAQSRLWQPDLHELGQFQAKHGVALEIINYYTDGVGNPDIPQKLAAEQRKRTRVARRKRLLAAAALIFCLTTALGLSFLFRRDGPGSVSPGIVEKSIAVLPFENFSDNKENSYFADGVQDDILTDLAKVADLKVIGRRSVAQYRGNAVDARTIGRALQVAYVLEGTVRKLENRILVTAQLIDTRTDLQKWGEKYERELADVFAIQSDISQTIVAQLKAALLPAEKVAIESAPTRDMEAYDLYLRGKEMIFSLGTSTNVEPDIAGAIDLLNQAVARDPHFAVAYSFLSEVYVSRFRSGRGLPDDLEKARMHMETAVRLAPASGEARFAEARYFYQGLRDYGRAQPAFKLALEKLPNDADILHWNGVLERRMGHWAAALRDLRKATYVDPHDSDAPYDLAVTFELLRNYDEALRTIDRALIALPQLANRLRAHKARFAMSKGDLKAVRAILQSIPADDRWTFILYLRARLAYLERNYAEAERVLAEVPQDTEFDRQWVARDHAFIVRAAGDAAKARQACLQARQAYEKTLAQPHDPLGYSMVAIFDAALGRKAEALRVSQEALDLIPKAGDATDGPGCVRNHALVLSWTGDREGALKVLSGLVERPGGVHPGELRFDPVWDELRSDARFSAIVAAAEQPAKIDNPQ
jgi:TolB-like protein